MIQRVVERLREDGLLLYRTYSDLGLLIQKVNTDEIYECAIDRADANYEYIETELTPADFL